MQNNHVKNAEELALMRRAAEITDEVYDYVLSLVREGVTEREVADAILEKTLELGASGVSFDTIVAFGAGGAEPHHVPSDKKLEKGMFVTVDMGAVVGGYCSDFTRTFAFGDVDAEQLLACLPTEAAAEAPSESLVAEVDASSLRLKNPALLVEPSDAVGACFYGQPRRHRRIGCLAPLGRPQRVEAAGERVGDKRAVNQGGEAFVSAEPLDDESLVDAVLGTADKVCAYAHVGPSQAVCIVRM